MTGEGMSTRQIAEQVGCGQRTVVNDRGNSLTEQPCSPTDLPARREKVYALRRRMREMYDRRAKERQAAAGEHGKEGGRGNKKTLPVNLPEGFDDKPKSNDARDEVGKVVGVCGQ